ncbi:MAG: hypothetical protein ACBR12_25150 [Microcoleus sp.]
MSLPYFLNELIGKDSKSMIVRFEENNANLSIEFNDLCDGEKCFFLCAVVLAASKFYGPLFCFWDEPDNYLSLSEVEHFVMSLHRNDLTAENTEDTEGENREMNNSDATGFDIICKTNSL